MFKPEISGFDPSIVFTPDYWGEVAPMVHREVPGMGSSGRPLARALLNRSGVKIIQGSVTGPQAPDGTVIDINDPDLNQTSFYNYPGNILIVDYESLEDTTKLPQPILEEAEPYDIVVSPRKLLQDDMFEWGKGTAVVSYPQAARALYQGESKYRRTVSLVVTTPGRRGGVDVFEVFSFTPRQVGHAGWATLYTGTVLRDNRLEIGQSYKLARVSGAESIFRLRSVEAAVTGAPAKVPKKSFDLLKGLITRPTGA